MKIRFTYVIRTPKGSKYLELTDQLKSMILCPVESYRDSDYPSVQRF